MKKRKHKDYEAGFREPFAKHIDKNSNIINKKDKNKQLKFNYKPLVDENNEPVQRGSYYIENKKKRKGK